MKRLLTVLIVCLTYVVSGQNWPPKNAEWIFTVPNEANNPYYDFQIYKHEKDTVINNKTCRIISGRYARDILYEENNRIYYYFLDSFNLLYDFNKTVGDTVVYRIRSYKKGSYIRHDTIREVICFVEEVDTLDFGSEKLKSFKTTILNYDPYELEIVWPAVYNYIERIGHTNRFIFDIPVPSIDLNNNLRCYKDAEIDFVNPWWEKFDADCKTAYWNNLIDEEGALKTVYPNPVVDELNINIGLNITSGFNLIITDVKGLVVKSIFCNSKMVKIDMEGVLPGMYFVYANTGVLNKNFKIIKQ